MSDERGTSAREDLLEGLSWRLPEYWMLALCGAAWIALVARAGGRGPVHCPGVAAGWWHWMLMVMAMMLPLKIDGVRLTAERSLWRRRNRATAGYLGGYLGVWALAGVPLAWSFATFHLVHRIDWRVGAAVGFLIEGVWLISPWKERAARLGHLTLPLAPSGWRADADCLASGGLAGLGCAANCWPLMLVCWLSGHSLVAMVFSFALGWSDRHASVDRKLLAAAMVLVGASFAALHRLLV